MAVVGEPCNVDAGANILALFMIKLCHGCVYTCTLTRKYQMRQIYTIHKQFTIFVPFMDTMPKKMQYFLHGMGKIF